MSGKEKCNEADYFFAEYVRFLSLAASCFRRLIHQLLADPGIEE